jgi:hypothetical protein
MVPVVETRWAQSIRWNIWARRHGGIGRPPEPDRAKHVFERVATTPGP